MQIQPNASAVAALVATVLLCSASIAQAQSAKKSEKPSADKTATAKPVAAKSVAKKKAEKKVVAASRASHTNLRSAAVNAAAGIQAAEAAMTPAELAIAERVQVGKMPCELGASVTLTADAKNPGYFDMQGKNFSYRMFPVATSTGAIRLEDQKGGAVWLQLANKSMLMSQKLGIRLADECTSPAQLEVAQNLKLNPPVSILEALPPQQGN